MTPENPLPMSTPAAQGIDPAAISAFLRAVETQQLELHSFVLLRHGHTVAQGWWHPYRADLPHMLFSLSKSFTSTAVGLAIDEGHFTVDDCVVDFFPDESPDPISPNLAAMRVHHLLTMTTGHVEAAIDRVVRVNERNWSKAFLALPVEERPGSLFVYNSGATYMLSAIVQQVTGQTLLDYLRPRLFDPLGIAQATWERCPRGINTGGWGLNLTTTAIARFGQLYLQRGEWQGQQLLPAPWVAKATAYQTPNNGENPDWAQGYGYQFWRCRHNAYRGDGAFGQFCIVLPAQDAVLAITSGTNDLQAVLDQVWEQLLPALQSETLPAVATAQQLLETESANLAIPPATGEADPLLAQTISGQRFELAANTSFAAASELLLHAITLTFTEGQTICCLEDEAGTHYVRSGQGQWIESRTTYRQPEGQQVAAAGAWVGAGTYVMKLQLIETPFCLTISCHFSEEKLHYQAALNVSFGPTTVALVGRPTPA